MKNVILALLATLAVAGNAGAAGPAPAAGPGQPPQALETLLGRLRLPFGVELRSVEQSWETSPMFITRRRMTLVPTDGPWAGREVAVMSMVGIPGRLEAGAVQDFVKAYTEGRANKGNAVDADVVQVGGHPFNVLELSEEGKGGARRLLIAAGAVNGNVLVLEIAKPGDEDGGIALRDAFAGLRLDFLSMLRLRGQLQAEQARVVGGSALRSPVGDLPLPRGSESSLREMSVVRDGDGRVRSLAHTYFLAKTGFWETQFVALTVGCYAPDDREGVEARWQAMDEAKRAVFSRSAQPARLGGQDGLAWYGGRPLAADPGKSTELLIWRADRVPVLEVQLEHIGDRALARTMQQTLDQARFQCRFDTQAGAPAGAG